MNEDDVLDQRKQPFNERLMEMVRGKRKNIYEVLSRGESNDFSWNRSLCMQYNLRQKPKSSFGIAFYNLHTRKWFVIEPKHTIEMRVIIKGCYSESTLPLLIEQVYDEELEVLASLENPDSFQELFDQYYGTPLREDHLGRLAKRFWNKNWKLLREFAVRIKEYRKTEKFVVSQMIFPKGRPLDGELPFLTAKREVEEETGIKLLFENSHISIKHLSKGGGYSRGYSEEDPFDTDVSLRGGFWEPCHIDFPDGVDELTHGYVCREFVSQLHSDISGRIYKTTVWICVFALETDPAIPLDPKNYESRGGVWMSESELHSSCRVTELFNKCETLLTRYYPYLMV